MNPCRADIGTSAKSTVEFINLAGSLLLFTDTRLLIKQPGILGMSLYRQVLFSFALLATAAAAVAETTPDLTRGKVIVPDEIPGVETLTAEGLIEKANNTEGLIIIDARISKDRAIGYIEDSVSLPDINTNCDTLSKLVSNRQTPLLFYCNGVRCGRSVVAVKIAKSCGYTNLAWFRGGFEEWQEKGYQYMTQDKLDSH